VLRWNRRQAYLGRLAERGAPVVPDALADRLSRLAHGAAARAFGSDRLVAKPRISSTAWQTIRWSPATPLAGGPEGPAMVQPLSPRDRAFGEVSMIYFGGAFSHAIAKRPQPGDFRVQPDMTGSSRRTEPAPTSMRRRR
jgi:hypothetical protein